MKIIMNKNQSKAIVLLTLLAGIAYGCSDKTAVYQRPNVLFIMTDDHTQQALHAYGHGLLDTVLFPNMDRLAKEGAIFMQSFVTNSICAPSRAVMLTGKYSHINGKIDNSVRFNWDQPTYPKYLQQSGYYWGWDMKFENNPFTGNPSRLPAPFGRMTEEQLAAWNAVYVPPNEAFLKEKPEGRELAKFMYHRYLRDYLKTVKSVDDGIGIVLKYLEENDLLNNTIIIYNKLIHFYYDVDEWEMYDLETDPMEMKNVYDDPAYADVRKMLHKRLEEVREYYGDSDELNDKYLKAYLGHQARRRQ